jgi:hypothetical protein
MRGQYSLPHGRVSHVERRERRRRWAVGDGRERLCDHGEGYCVRAAEVVDHLGAAEDVDGLEARVEGDAEGGEVAVAGRVGGFVGVWRWSALSLGCGARQVAL